MQRLLPSLMSISRQYSVMKLSKSLGSNEGQKCLNLQSSDILCKYLPQGPLLLRLFNFLSPFSSSPARILAASMTESQTASVDESLRTDTIPLLDHTTTTEVSPTTFEVSTMKVDTQIFDKAPLPFDEIPGPAILKIWEKYWKYVPLLGTQLLSSLLINRFTQGTIC